MEGRIPGFRGEYLWELDVPQVQLLALAGVIPEEVYRWRPAEGARSLSEVLVHVAATNLLLLEMAGGSAPCSLEQVAGMVRRNTELERTVTEKTAVIELLKRSLEAVRQTFTAAGDEELARSGEFFGEVTTVRRVYLRMLAHTHEHMGQAIAYARANGIRVPWEDPIEEIERMVKEERAG